MFTYNDLILARERYAELTHESEKLYVPLNLNEKSHGVRDTLVALRDWFMHGGMFGAQRQANAHGTVAK